MPFYREQNRPPGRLPEFGAIFMSNAATKAECFKRKLFGLPPGQADFVRHVKAGMILFLFEYGKRELHGVFQATSDGGMDIVPNAYSSSGMKFPAQVRFTAIWRCSPLSETLFSGVIRENYFSEKKFNFGLNERQVENLLQLFHSRRLERQPHRFTQSKTKASVLDDVNEHEESVNDGDLHTELYGQSPVAVSEADPSSQNSDRPFSFNGRLTSEYTSSTIGNEHRLNDRSLPHTADENVSDFIRDAVEGAVRDSSQLRKNDLGYENSAVGDRSHISEHILGTSRRESSTGYDSPVSSHKQGARHSYPPVYGNDFIYERDTFVDDALHHTSGMHHSVEPRYSPTSYPASYMEAMPRPFSSSYSVSSRETDFANPRPYNPEAPGFDINHSPLLRVSSSLPESLPRHSNAYPSYDNQLLLPNRAVGEDISLGYDHSKSYNDTPSDYGEDSYRSNMPYYWNAPVERDVPMDLPRPSLPPLPVTENLTSHTAEKSFWPPVYTPVSGLEHLGTSLEGRIRHSQTQEVPSYSVPNLVGTDSRRRTSYGANSPAGWDGGHDSQRIHLNDKTREGSVFNRLVFPTQETEQGTYDDDNKDLSVNGIMTSLRQSRCQWAKEKPAKVLTEKHNGAQSSWNAKRFPLRSKISNNPLAEVPAEIDASAADGSDDDALPKYENPPFVDFKRRSSLRKADSEANTSDHSMSTDNVSPLTEPRKRRKLIRPDFCDVMAEKLEKERSSSQIVDLSVVESCTTQEGNNVAANQSGLDDDMGEKLGQSSPSSVKSPDDGGTKSMHEVEILDSTLSAANKAETRVTTTTTTNSTSIAPSAAIPGGLNEESKAPNDAEVKDAEDRGKQQHTVFLS